MLIIVEGSDCSGKTTLIEAMSREFDMEITKGSSFELSQCSQDELYSIFKEISKEGNLIVDRFIYSNEVYAQLYDDYAILSDEQRRAIEDSIRDKALLIYLTADIETLTERLNSRGDDYVKAERLPHIKEGYKEALSKIDNIRTLEFDTGVMSTSEVLEVIKMKLK